MQLIYEEQDVVEFRGVYWTVLGIAGYNTLYLRNSAGAVVDDVPLDQVKPSPQTIRSATYSTTRP